MPELTLYIMPTCPYCRKVQDFLKNNGFHVPLKDTSADPAVRQELCDIGGKSQVPCLVIDGKALYESNDIIQWFQKNFNP